MGTSPRHVVVRVERERYALPLAAVREVVVPPERFARVPRAPAGGGSMGSAPMGRGLIGGVGSCWRGHVPGAISEEKLDEVLDVLSMTHPG